MFVIIESLEPIFQALSPTFTQPSFQTHLQVSLGWIMCLGRRTEYGVFQTIRADAPVARSRWHPFDRFYNFFSSSAWTVHDLAYHVAVVRLNPQGRWLVSEHLAAYRFRGLIPHPGIVTWVTEAENYVRDHPDKAVSDIGSVGACYEHIGAFYLSEGRLEEARETLEKAHACRQLGGEGERVKSRCQAMRGEVHRRLGVDEMGDLFGGV